MLHPEWRRAAERNPKPVLKKKNMNNNGHVSVFVGKLTPKLPRNVEKEKAQTEIKIRDDAQRIPDLSIGHMYAYRSVYIHNNASVHTRVHDNIRVIYTTKIHEEAFLGPQFFFFFFEQKRSRSNLSESEQFFDIHCAGFALCISTAGDGKSGFFAYISLHNR